jgi:hypothetical protein
MIYNTGCKEKVTLLLPIYIEGVLYYLYKRSIPFSLNYICINFSNVIYIAIKHVNERKRVLI